MNGELKGKKIGLFIPCYINAVYPEVGIACYKLLKSLDLDVDYPLDQTCCGQPMANGGFEEKSLPLAERFEQLFLKYDYIVGPSASCVAFVREFHPEILGKEPHECHSVQYIYDIAEFLHDIVKPEHFASKFPHTVSLHNSCHGVRELGLSSASEQTVPYFNKVRALLEKVDGITVKEPERIDECCGFGGLFSVEEPEVSGCMGHDKVRDHMSTGAEYITGADSSCLMHMQGVIDREHLPINTIHFLQILTANL
ncbi:MAG: (Fe-S)-binding protein [Bacteroidales bacterium]|uniref:(Fe-S)-binding protein n=1 Tax=Porphyromonas sp. TaxID=1924944 RepID=UPI002976A990|nr:(Fe-S)-binding protein [Porphyromonas sp.]MDD7437290.1 (Fe-S)-binding protein [Bacteroidales bacterium]MDY3066567.1 (Fe-S)-binding protein [Porphyromonas sp.]